MATVWETASLSVDNMLTLYCIILSISPLGFEGEAFVPIVPVPGHCL